MSRHASENATKFVALMIWKLRAHLKNLEVRLEVSDMEDFSRAFAGQRPVVAAIGEQGAVILRLLDQSGGALMLSSPEASLDHPEVVAMEAMLRAREEAPEIARRMKVWARSAEASADPVQWELLDEAAEALLLLSDKGR
jgi:hypothetical protein